MKQNVTDGPIQVVTLICLIMQPLCSYTGHLPSASALDCFLRVLCAEVIFSTVKNISPLVRCPECSVEI